MKKIFTLLTILLVATSLQTTVSAQNNILFGSKSDTTKVKKHPRSPFVIKRIDREINKNVFAYKGEWIAGISASYGTLTADDSDIAMIIENLRLGGSVVSVKPYLGYMYRNNLSIGARFGYTYMNGSFDNANINLGNFINGIELALAGLLKDL